MNPFSGIDILMMAGGFVGGLIQKMMSNGHDFKMSMMLQNYQDVRHARRAGDDWFKWTRRVIALTATFYIFVAPMYASLMGLPMWISYPDEHGFFVSLFLGDASIQWQRLPMGYVLTPLHQYTFEVIIGLYFGRK
jgi:hypothetical protein